MISDNISSSYFFCFPQCLSISTWSIWWICVVSRPLPYWYTAYNIM
jgi:hypothetical protein